MTAALAVAALATAILCGSLRLLVRASDDDHTPARTYVACIASTFVACTTLSVALLYVLLAVTAR